MPVIYIYIYVCVCVYAHINTCQMLGHANIAHTSCLCDRVVSGTVDLKEPLGHPEHEALPVHQMPGLLWLFGHLALHWRAPQVAFWMMHTGLAPGTDETNTGPSVLFLFFCVRKAVLFPAFVILVSSGSFFALVRFGLLWLVALRLCVCVCVQKPSANQSCICPLTLA